MLVCRYVDCNKVFPKKCNLRDHILVHRRIKPYRCVRCGKSHSQKSNCERHERNCVAKIPRKKKQV